MHWLRKSVVVDSTVRAARFCMYAPSHLKPILQMLPRLQTLPLLCIARHKTDCRWDVLLDELRPLSYLSLALKRTLRWKWSKALNVPCTTSATVHTKRSCSDKASMRPACVLPGGNAPNLEAES